MKSQTFYLDLAKGGILLVLVLAFAYALFRGASAPEPAALTPEPPGTRPPGTLTALQTPGVPGVAPPVFTGAGRVTFSGTGTPGTAVEIWANGQNVADTTVTESGVWLVETSLRPGDYQVVVVTRDTSGVVIDQSSPIGISVPEAGALPETDATPTPGPQDSAPEIVEAAVSESGQVSLTGTGPPGSRLVIFEDGFEAARVTVAADGTFQVTYQSTSAEHVFEVRVLESPPVQATPTVTAPAAPTATPTLIPIPPGGLVYIVQPGDWLVDLARKYYGDPTRWVDILVATNTKATLDASYAFLEDPNYIVAGWKIFIPEG